MGCPLVVQFWEDLQSVHGLRCYGNITLTRNVALCLVPNINKSSAVAEMGDRGHNRHRPKRGAVLLSRSAGNPSNTMWFARRSILPYQVASSSIQE